MEGIKRDSHQLYLGRVLLGALCPSWEEVRSSGWCGCIADETIQALAVIFNEDCETLAMAPERIKARLTHVLICADGHWGAVGGVPLTMPRFDEEDLVPQLQEWLHTGTPAYLANSAAAMNGALKD